MGTNSERRLYEISPVLRLVLLLAAALAIIQAAHAGAHSPHIGRGEKGAKRRSMQAKTCMPSQLTGFTSSRVLKRGLLLHWKPAVGNTIELAVEARVGSGAAKGWIALGFGPTLPGGSADTVVGQTNTAPVATYTITGDEQSQLLRSNSFAIGDATLERSRRRTVIRFTRNGGDGVSPLKLRGWNNIVWAYDVSGEKTVDFNNRRSGKLAVNLGCVGGAPATDTLDGANNGGIYAPSANVPAASAAPAVSYCPKSSLPGYTYTANLDGGSFVLHWKPVQGQMIQMAMEAKAGSAASNGWFSIGWSRDGSMSSSYAVIKSGASLAAYFINGYKRKNVVPTNEISLGAPSLARTSAGSLVAHFTLTAGQGRIPLTPSGLNYIIWAYSTGNQGIGYHGSNAGWVKIDFSCAFWTDNQSPNGGGGGSTSTPTSNSNNNDDDDNDDDDDDDDSDGNRSSWGQDMNQQSGKYYADQGTTYWEGVGQGVAQLAAPAELKKRLKAAEAKRKAERDAYNQQVYRQVYGPQQTNAAGNGN
ncbi:hypothetical protein CLOM_g5171 [Closterium sp. NIES-68]|nr:hypothetical protein CLOM_g5171 [Closterium sp. NIES-68]GJP82948.1 hypothetical protein CLOP_g13166 [Closterium sp. NIES-67]